MPLPNTAVIHPAWSQNHQPAAESAMRSRVDILKPLSEAPEPTFPPSDAEWDPIAAADVPARIRALSSGNEVAPSGQAYDSQAYLVQVPADLMPDLHIGKGNTAHRLRVTVNPEASGLVGQVMQILAAPHESEAFARDLYTQVHTTQEQR